MVYDTPTVIITQSGNNLTASGGVTYQWYKNGQLIAGADSSVYTPQESGTYSVVVASAEGCSGVSADYNFVFTSLGDFPDGFFGVIPNPAKDFIVVNVLYSGHAVFKLQRMDGRLLLTKQLTTTPEKIWLHEIPAGIYIASVQANGLTLQEKIVVK
jgi:hypothetical protein